MNLKLLPIWAFLIFSYSLKAQTSLILNSAEIKQNLKKLNVLGSVLYVAAHPDDENTRLLTYLAKERKMRTGYLSITRGDGGQNLIGNEQGELLGLIRTQELLAARRMDGAEQFFTRAIDFGFSKNQEETFKIWGKENILSDAVWVIRKFKPDVIITRFPEDTRAGHGHHTASAIIAHEAFIAAADPNRFPEQLKFVETWQAKRVIWNTFNFGGNNTTSNDQLKLDVGAFNTLLGKGNGEIAAESRSNHKSQGFGSARQRGETLEFFSHLAGDSAKIDLFDGVGLTWNKIKNSNSIQKLITHINENYNIEDPSKSVSELLKVLTEIEKLPDGYWKTQKEKEVKDIILSASGLWFESYASEAVFAQGDSIKVSSQIICNSNVSIILKQISDLPQKLELKKGTLQNLENAFIAPNVFQQYWLAQTHPVGIYTVKDQQTIGNPENEAPINVKFVFEINGKQITYIRPVVYKYTDQVRGEIYQPLSIAPYVTSTIAEKSYVITDNRTLPIKVQLKSFRNNSSGSIIPNIPKGWSITPEKINFEKLNKGGQQTVEFNITPNGKLNSGNISFQINSEGKMFDRSLKTINYDHIPVQTIFPLSESRVENINLKIAGKKIGYIAGAGDLIPEALKQIGYEVTMLNNGQLLGTNLSQFDAIITGVRAYNVNKELKLIQPKLMDYVKNGGTLLVQYNVNNPLMLSEIGPYPFKISRDRVTDENARVEFLDKNNAALNYPNKITEKDFEGWVQERGLYFLSDVDVKYTPILKMNDPDESAKEGSLIIADYGKGKFVYTSLAFFRQLPAGVPGAYRLFVNLISGKQK